MTLDPGRNIRVRPAAAALGEGPLSDAEFRIPAEARS